MSTAPAIYGYAEFQPEQGHEDYEGVRVTLASKIAYERSAKAQGWNHEDNEFTVGAYWAWHAGRTAGKHDLDWKAFLEAVVDAGVTAQAPAQPAPDDTDPTQQGATTA